ncbi:MAG TPA: BCAM0308 family protein [Pyrinomonadaceae bacterium]|nr:ATPase [Acidobacteriota bacterium]HQZ98166.1 BCAM0308 family protein [Pyrinomonadaceae bacterium]
MVTKKHYTNETFTKRVDHEGGEHRSHDSSIGTAHCIECGAIYTDKRWVARSDSKETSEHVHWRPGKETTCPACKQLKQGVVGGYFVLDGDFLTKHRDEINSLIDNETRDALQDNPLSRIMDRHDEDGKLVIETTTEHLAQRLGHAVEKAYDGKTVYDFSHENKVARVHWTRN